MQRFFTGRLDGPQCNGKPLEPIGEVQLGETFVIESTLIEKQEGLGPIFIKGIHPGGVVAIHIDDIKVTKWNELEADMPMIPEVLDCQRVEYFEFDVPLEKGELVFPGDIRVPLCPMIGCVSLAAKEVCANPWAHGGNMDINEIRKGSTVYIRAQHKGGLFALGDLHAYQGDGEISGSAMEADGEATITVSASNKFPAPRPVIEVDDRVMTVGMAFSYWEAVRSAVRDMTYLLMKVMNLSLEEAYSVAVQVGSLRNGAIWMMSDHVVVRRFNDDRMTPRTVFLEIPFKSSSQ
jgi:amidase